MQRTWGRSIFAGFKKEQVGHCYQCVPGGLLDSLEKTLEGCWVLAKDAVAIRMIVAVVKRVGPLMRRRDS